MQLKLFSYISDTCDFSEASQLLIWLFCFQLSCSENWDVCDDYGNWKAEKDETQMFAATELKHD